MPKGRSVSILSTWVWLVIMFFFMNDHQAASLYALPQTVPDTIRADTLSSIQSDTLREDRGLVLQDTAAIPRQERTSIEAMVERTAIDSIVQDLMNRRVYLYGDAVVNYENITLKAAVIEVDFNTNTVYAYGREDSTGKLVGNPEFTEGQTNF